MATPIIEAHRGYSAIYPENTMLAFKEAIKAGAESIELDVHVTADGELVVMHDATLERTSNGTGAIAESTWTNLQKLDAGAWKNASFAGEPIPSLAQTLALSDTNAIAFNVEVKRFLAPEQSAAKLVAMLRRHAPSRGYHVVSSFDLDALLQVRAADNKVPLAILGSNGEQVLAIAMEHNFPWIHVNSKAVTNELVQKAHARQIKVMVWTVDDIEMARTLTKMGVEKICTNKPLEMIQAKL